MRTRRSKWIKVVHTGRLSVFRDASDPNRYEVSWRKAGGSYGRRRFNAETIDRAIELAPVVAGLEQDKPQVEGITLLDGLTKALNDTRRGPRGRRDWLRQQTRFLAWLEKERPTVGCWHQVTRQTVKDYLRSLDGRSPNHRRLMFQPIVQTAGHLEREFQLPNVTRRLGIGTANVRPTPSVFISDVVALLDFLKDKRPRLEAGAALQGLAALRVTEALRLTWDKVDLERGIIEVSGETKTAWSNRTIPIPDRALDALRRAWERRADRGVIDSHAPVLALSQDRGYLTKGGNWDVYTRHLREAIREWNPKAGWQVKDLRNAVPTALAMAGLASDASEQYMGHAPRGVTARHYIPRLSAMTRGEEAAFAQAMRHFRSMVVDHLNRMAAGTEARILNVFDPGVGTAEAKEA